MALIVDTINILANTVKKNEKGKVSKSVIKLGNLNVKVMSGFSFLLCDNLSVIFKQNKKKSCISSVKLS